MTSDKDDAKGTAEKPKKTAWRSFRENVEAVIVAIILALIIRHFSLEAFEIPTGSMAPGLHGVHVETTCPNCETVESVSIRADSETGRPTVPFRSGWIYDGSCPQCEAHIEARAANGAMLRCPNPECGYVAGHPEHYRMAVHDMFKSRCRECTLAYNEVFEPDDILGGHKILVNKFTYQIRDPRRWEVIVFKFNHQRNYIKRLIGLPGERIRVHWGDIWINGEVERKPQWAQDQLWFPVHDSSIVERGYVKTSAWVTDGNIPWVSPTVDEDSAVLNALDRPVHLLYNRPIENRYAYNVRNSAGNDAMPGHAGTPSDWFVRDVRLQADLALQGGRGRIELELVNGQRVYRLSIPAGSEGKAQLWFDDLAAKAASTDPSDESWRYLLHELTDDETFSLLREQPTAIDFYLADRQLVVRVDGQTRVEHGVEENLLSQQVADADIPRASVGIRASRGVAARVDRLQVFRDIHYTTAFYRYQYATHGDYQIGDDRYFAMGDNSPSSLDSRAWETLAAQNMLGRGFVIFWPAWPWRFEMDFIR